MPPRLLPIPAIGSSAGCRGSGSLRSFDLRTLEQAAEFGGASGGGGAVAAVAFSENGYHMASAGGGGTSLWDLRKVGLVRTWGGEGGEGGGATASVAFDSTGLYCASGGADGVVVDICSGTGIGNTVAFYEDRPTDYNASDPGLGSVFRAAIAVSQCAACQ